MHSMVLVVEEAQVEALFGLLGYSANLDARLLHSLHGTYHMLRNQFGRTQWNFKMTCHMESRFGLFGENVSFVAR